MGIDGNEIATQLVSQGSSNPSTEPEPILGKSARVARLVINGWTSRKHERY